MNGQAASYDFENHLVSLSTNNTVLASYTYDADGNRISASNLGTTTSYAVDTSLPYASVIEEYAGGSAVVSARYDYGDDLVRMDRGGVYYYLYDGLGSTRQLVNTSGTVTDTWGYSAFGEMASHTGSTINPFLFNAQQFDQASGDYYLRARYYDQSNGRFLSQDPFGGDEEDPITLHRYLYTMNDPANLVDPGGQDAGDTSLGGISAGTVGTAILAASLYSVAFLLGVLVIANVTQQIHALPVLLVHTGITPTIAANIDVAQTLGGKPYVLYWDKNPINYASRRAAALSGFARPVPAFGPGIPGSWDEYPFASTTAGGAGASVVLVPLLENSTQGGQVGYFYYRDPNGLHGFPGTFVVQVVP